MNFNNLSYRLLPIAAQRYQPGEQALKNQSFKNAITNNVEDVFVPSHSKDLQQAENKQNKNIFLK